MIKGPQKLFFLEFTSLYKLFTLKTIKPIRAGCPNFLAELGSSHMVEFVVNKMTKRITKHQQKNKIWLQTTNTESVSNPN